MPAEQAVYRLVESRGPAHRVVLRHDSPDAVNWIVCAAYEGPEWPAFVTAPSLERLAEQRWSLRAAETSFEFRARAVQRIEERPAFYEPMHRPFALSAVDRFAVRILLALLRLPGSARLLRLWHERRA